MERCGGGAADEEAPCGVCLRFQDGGGGAIGRGIIDLDEGEDSVKTFGKFEKSRGEFLAYLFLDCSDSIREVGLDEQEEKESKS